MRGDEQQQKHRRWRRQRRRSVHRADSMAPQKHRTLQAFHQRMDAEVLRRLDVQNQAASRPRGEYRANFLPGSLDSHEKKLLRSSEPTKRREMAERHCKGCSLDTESERRVHRLEMRQRLEGEMMPVVEIRSNISLQVEMETVRLRPSLILVGEPH